MSTVRSALAAATICLVSACTPGSDDGPDGAAPSAIRGGAATFVLMEDRKPAPVVKGETLDGGQVDATAWRGSPVVVNFWASWCGPCKDEQPHLSRVAAQTRALDVRFVGVDVKDTRANALARVRRFGVTYPSVFDKSYRLTARFTDVTLRALPTTFVLDAQGRIAARFYGPVLDHELLPVVQRVAGESPGPA